MRSQRETGQALGPLKGRVAFFVPKLDGGGAERDAILLANGLQSLGCPAAIVTLDSKGPLRSLVEPEVVLVDLGRRRAKRLATALPAMRSLLDRSGMKAIVASQPAAIALVVVARELVAAHRRPKLIAREVGNPRLGRKGDPYLQNRIAYAFAPLVYRRADLCITLTEGVREDLIELFGLPASSTINLRTNAVLSEADLKRIRETPPSPEDGVIVSVGRLSHEKGQDLLLDAFASLLRKRPAKLILVGDGPAREKYEAQARALGIAEHVEFAGYSPDPISYLLRAAVFVSSSRYEGLGNAVVEALACNVPVVATDAPYGPGEVLERGKWGRLVALDSPSALANALDLELEDPLQVQRLERALDYTIRAAAQAFLRALRSVAD